MNKRLMTDMADANGLQRAIRPTEFFNFKKIAADFCSAQYMMDNTGSLICIATFDGCVAFLLNYLFVIAVFV